MKKITLALLVLLVAIAGVSAEEVDADRATPPQIKARTQLSPFYPATATLFGTEATVVLRADIGADGRISDLSVIDCDRPELGFEQSALDAVRHWRFKPARSGGQAVGTTTTVTLRIAPPAGGGFGESRSVARIAASEQFGFVRSAQPKDPGQPQPSGGPHLEKIRKVERPTCSRGDVTCSTDRRELNRTRRLIRLPSSSGSSGGK